MWLVFNRRHLCRQWRPLVSSVLSARVAQGMAGLPGTFWNFRSFQILTDNGQKVQSSTRTKWRAVSTLPWLATLGSANPF